MEGTWRMDSMHRFLSQGDSQASIHTEELSKTRNTPCLAASPPPRAPQTCAPLPAVAAVSGAHIRRTAWQA